MKPDASHGWRARYRDPDSGATVKERLPAYVTTGEAREAWAAHKSRELSKRRHALAEGAPRASGTLIADSISRYYEAHPRLREKTLRGYRAATDKLIRWAARSGYHSVDDLNRARLMRLREELINEPKRAPAKGGRRGARVAADNARSAFSVNRELAALRTVTRYWLDCDLLAHATESDLRRAFKKLPTSIERIEFLRVDDLRRLFEACAAHDAAMFTETRAEHKARVAIGSTPRHDPVSHVVAIILLSGMRLGEAISLPWSQVDLNAGEIHLTGATKTKRARTIDLSVSPALASLLERMRPADGRGRVLPGFTEGVAKATVERLRADFDAPPTFTWQVLRATCGTYLTNAPGIFGAASAYRSARQLGHSVAVAERHYLGVVKISPEARTLEAAMGIEDMVARIGRADV